VSAFRFALAAHEDLAEVLDFVEQASSTSRAEQFLDDILRAGQLLAEHPRLGHLRRDLTPLPVRFWPVHSILLVYRPDTSPLEIVRVLSGWRDVSRLLEDLG